MPKDEPDAVALAPLLAGQRLIGVVKNYNGSTGFGFVTCAETQQLFKRDVFLQRQEVLSSGAKVGSTVSFTVELNKDGKPQARHVEVLSPEEDELKMPGQSQGTSAKDGPAGLFQEMMSSVDDFVEGVVSEMQRYEGHIKSFSKEHGFGFVASVDTHRIFGRDVFLHQSNLNGCVVGDAITFRIDIDPLKGTPRAKDVSKAPVGTMERIQSGGLDTMDIFLAAIGVAAIQMSVMSLNPAGTVNGAAGAAGVSDMLAMSSTSNIQNAPPLPLAGNPCAPNIPSAPTLPLAGTPCATSIPGLHLAATPGMVAATPGIPAAIPSTANTLPGILAGINGVAGAMDPVPCRVLGGQAMTAPIAPVASGMFLGQNFLSAPAMSNVSLSSTQPFVGIGVHGVPSTLVPGVLDGSKNSCLAPGMLAGFNGILPLPAEVQSLTMPGMIPALAANTLPFASGTSHLHLQPAPTLGMSSVAYNLVDVPGKLDATPLNAVVTQSGAGKELSIGNDLSENGVSTVGTNTIASMSGVAMNATANPLVALGAGGMDLQAVAKMMSAMGMKSVKIPKMEKIQAYLANQERQDAAVKMQIEQLQQLAQKGDEKPERRGAVGGMPQAPPPEFDTKQRFVGIINKFNRARGFGFIKCDETYAAYGDDVFLHNEQRDGFEVGDVVSFALEIRGTQARARDLRTATGKSDKGYDKECEPSSLDRWGAMKNRTRLDRVNLHEDREKKDRSCSPAKDREKCRSRSRSRSRDRRKR